MALVVPWPFGRDKTADKRLPRFSFRAAHAQWTLEDERRQRADIERAFRTGDDALAQIERRLRALEEATGIIP